MVSEHSDIVKNGMKRLCGDFHELIVGLDFQKAGHRRWQRKQGDFLEEIHLWRNGSSYGAPSTNSIDIEVNLSSKNLTLEDDFEPKMTSSKLVRKKNGYVYHLRFNAKSWSTYELCLEDLKSFIQEYAEPWFSAQKKSSGLTKFFTNLFKGNQ